MVNTSKVKDVVNGPLDSQMTYICKQIIKLLKKIYRLKIKRFVENVSISKIYFSKPTCRKNNN